MKLLLVSNSRNSVPAAFDDAVNFRALFNQVVLLPRFCQVCILSSTVDDANSPKLHYVQFTNLPLQTKLGNCEKGGTPKIVGAILSDVADYHQNWINLDNPSEMTITELDVKIVNQDGELSSGLSNSTEFLVGYRQDPAMKGTTQY